MHRFTTAIVVAVAGVAGPGRAAIINVPGDAPTIQVAINLAADSDEVVVAPGTYFESLNLLGKAITLRSSDGPDATTIDAFGQLDSAIHAISGETPDTVIEGFTITRGNADGIPDGDAGASDRGGGLYADHSSVTVLNCKFIDNVASGFGGGFYINVGTVSFTDCLFELNQADYGGGAYLNDATGTFTDCAFLTNDALASSGGGMRAITGTTTLTGCRFEGNTTVESGGGIDFTTNLTVTACMFIGNDAFNGGGIFASGPATIRDSLFNGNSADNLGGGVYVNTPGDVTMVNATVAHNTSGTAGLWNSGAASLINCILWANAGSALGGNPTVTYSLVQGGFAGSGNVDADPQFVNPAGPDTVVGTADDDLRLSAGSPAIDAADARAVTGEYPLDLDGNPRALDDSDTTDTGVAVLGLSVDMGAYEFQPGPASASCPGDLDGDNVVGVTDFLQLLANFGACP
jgi:hypothetical protein